MFNVNDKVVYGHNGVCTIVDIKPLQFDSHSDQSSKYFYLHPIGSKDDHVIYVPVEKVMGSTCVMRNLLCGKELESVVDNIPNIPPLCLKNEKNRREEYKTALLTLEPQKCIALIKSVKNRRRSCTTQRKNISETDLEYEKLATKFICLELSEVLSITYEEAECRVLDKIDFE